MSGMDDEFTGSMRCAEQWYCARSLTTLAPSMRNDPVLAESSNTVAEAREESATHSSCGRAGLKAIARGAMNAPAGVSTVATDGLAPKAGAQPLAALPIGEYGGSGGTDGGGGEYGGM